MYERFTDRARRVVVNAQEEARVLQHAYTGTEHLLLGLITGADGIVAKVLSSQKIDTKAIRSQVEQAIGKDKFTGSIARPVTPGFNKVLELSLREALLLGHNYIGTEHLLLGLIREDKCIAAETLIKHGLELDSTRQLVVKALRPPLDDDTAKDSEEATQEVLTLDFQQLRAKAGTTRVLMKFNAELSPEKILTLEKVVAAAIPGSSVLVFSTKNKLTPEGIKVTQAFLDMVETCHTVDYSTPE